MAPLTPQQQANRARVEALIRLMEPGLNLVLAVGERISRIAEPEDHDYYPPRPVGTQARAAVPAAGPPFAAGAPPAPEPPPAPPRP